MSDALEWMRIERVEMSVKIAGAKKYEFWPYSSKEKEDLKMDMD